MLLIILAIFSGIKGDRYHFMYKAIGYQNHDPVMNALKNATYRELGLKLDVQDSYKSQKLNEVTACLEVSLSYGLPVCIFDIGGIQFFYSSPTSQPGYGHIRFTDEQDRTVIFFPPDKFETNNASIVCLVVKFSAEESHIKLFWNGNNILKEVKTGKNAMVPIRQQLLKICLLIK